MKNTKIKTSKADKTQVFSYFCSIGPLDLLVVAVDGLLGVLANRLGTRRQESGNRAKNKRMNQKTTNSYTVVYGFSFGFSMV